MPFKVPVNDSQMCSVLSSNTNSNMNINAGAVLNANQSSNNSTIAHSMHSNLFLSTLEFTVPSSNSNYFQIIGNIFIYS